MEFFAIRILIICSSLILSSSCASLPVFLFPTVSDERLEAFIADEASRVLKVSENAHNAARYKFFLANFPREDILGLSIGEHRILISYELTLRAYAHKGYLWLFRHTLAHEIAHDALDHSKHERAPNVNAISRSPGQIQRHDLGLPALISFRNYSVVSELAADRKAIEYWQKIGWDCRIWIKLFRGFLDQGYTGDPNHPTEERLAQAMRLCHSGPSQEGVFEAGQAMDKAKDSTKESTKEAVIRTEAAARDAVDTAKELAKGSL